MQLLPLGNSLVSRQLRLGGWEIPYAVRPGAQQRNAAQRSTAWLEQG